MEKNMTLPPWPQLQSIDSGVEMDKSGGSPTKELTGSPRKKRQDTYNDNVIIINNNSTPYKDSPPETPTVRNHRNDHHVTIESLSDDDDSDHLNDDSSVLDSSDDSDLDNISKDINNYMNGIGKSRPSNSPTSKSQQSDNDDHVIVLNHNSIIESSRNGGTSPSTTAIEKPTIGSIAVQNSSDITFGNKTFYQGPVTIKQFLLESNKWKPHNGDANSSQDGQDNPSFNNSYGDVNKPTKTNSSSDKERGDHTPTLFKQLKRKLLIERNPVVIGLVVATVIFLVAIIILLAILLQNGYDSDDQSSPGDGDDLRPHIPINSTIGNDLLGGGSSLRFVTRDEWLAQPPNADLNTLDLPVHRVIIAHTATENCDTQARCVFVVRHIQNYDIESGRYDDIKYNFLIGADGSAYEGRGWNKEGAHTRDFNDDSICIAFIGTFRKDLPNNRQILAAKMLLQQGVLLKKLDPNYKLYGQSQLMPTESPGPLLFNIIKTWPHWKNVTAL